MRKALQCSRPAVPTRPALRPAPHAAARCWLPHPTSPNDATTPGHVACAPASQRSYVRKATDWLFGRGGRTGLPAGPGQRDISTSAKLKIAERQGNKCARCGEKLEYHYTGNSEVMLFDADHDKPRFEGGTDALDNRRALCLKCHRIKTNEERANNWGRGRPSITPPTPPAPRRAGR